MAPIYAVRPTQQLIILHPQGTGYVHLPPPLPIFQVSLVQLSNVSSFLREMFATTNSIYISKADDPFAIGLVLRVLHFQKPSMDMGSVTVQLMAKIAELCLKWRCMNHVGPCPRIWLEAVEAQANGNYEPYDGWLKIAKAFDRKDIEISIVEKQWRRMWKELGYPELERLRPLVRKDVIDVLQASRIAAIAYIGKTAGEYLDVIYQSPNLCKATGILVGESEYCSSLLLGSFIRLLLQCVLHRIPKKPFGPTTIQGLLGTNGVEKDGIIGLGEHPNCTEAARELQAKLRSAIASHIAALDRKVAAFISYSVSSQGRNVTLGPIQLTPEPAEKMGVSSPGNPAITTGASPRKFQDVEGPSSPLNGSSPAAKKDLVLLRPDKRVGEGGDAEGATPKLGKIPAGKKAKPTDTEPTNPLEAINELLIKDVEGLAHEGSASIFGEGKSEILETQLDIETQLTIHSKALELSIHAKELNTSEEILEFIEGGNSANRTSEDGIFEPTEETQQADTESWEKIDLKEHMEPMEPISEPTSEFQPVATEVAQGIKLFQEAEAKLATQQETKEVAGKASVRIAPEYAAQVIQIPAQTGPLENISFRESVEPMGYASNVRKASATPDLRSVIEQLQFAWGRSFLKEDKPGEEAAPKKQPAKATTPDLHNVIEELQSACNRKFLKVDKPEEEVAPKEQPVKATATPSLRGVAEELQFVQDRSFLKEDKFEEKVAPKEQTHDSGTTQNLANADNKLPQIPYTVRGRSTRRNTVGHLNPLASSFSPSPSPHKLVAEVIENISPRPFDAQQKPSSAQQIKKEPVTLFLSSTAKEWPSEQRKIMLHSLQDPASKGIVKYLRCKYREVDFSLILDILFKNNWDIVSSDKVIKELRDQMRQSASTDPFSKAN